MGSAGPADARDMQITSELIEQCKQDVTAAQVQLYELCYPRLMPVCLRYAQGKEQAREFLNMGFYRVLRGLRKYEYKGAEVFHYWSRRVVINAIIDHFRKNKKYRETIVQVENISANGMQTEEVRNTAALKMEAEYIYKMISELPPIQRTVFNLYVVEACPHKEIADRLGIEESTSRWHLLQARKEMRRKIEAFTSRKISMRS